MSRIAFGSIGIDPLTTTRAIARVCDLVDSRGGTIFTPNVHHAALAERDPEFAAAYAEAAVCLCDGTPLRWAASLQAEIPERIPGSTFLPFVLQEAATRRWRVAFVGGRGEVAPGLPALLTQRYPGLQLALLSEPTRHLTAAAPKSLDSLVDKLRGANVQLICVSLPSPLQEVWSQRAHAALGRGVFLCTGSAIDRLAGVTPKPPAWLGAVGLEWAWRIGQEPARLAPRYASDFCTFVPLLACAARKRWHGN